MNRSQVEAFARRFWRCQHVSILTVPLDYTLSEVTCTTCGHKWRECKEWPRE